MNNNNQHTLTEFEKAVMQNRGTRSKRNRYSLEVPICVSNGGQQ